MNAQHGMCLCTEPRDPMGVSKGTEKGCKQIYRASGPEHTTLQREAQAADNVLRRTMPKALRPLVLPLPRFPSFSFEFLPAHERLPSHPHLAKIFLLTALYWRPRPPGRSSCQVPTVYPISPLPDDMPYICASQDALKVETTPPPDEAQPTIPGGSRLGFCGVCGARRSARDHGLRRREAGLLARLSLYLSL